MIWNNLSEFLDMGGYGLYVWGSYAMSALLLVAELVVLSQKPHQPPMDPLEDES
ncbi:MAG: heme exporter protein CcmD [Betaproteobacteria bacterium]